MNSTTQLSFKASKYETTQVDKIVDRAIRMGYYDKKSTMTATMDLLACHANGCQLDLAKLLEAPDFDFAHDICGIRRHLNRTTGRLEDCFLPRTALPE